MISFSLALLSSANAELAFSPIPNNAPDGFAEVFSKHVDVFGLHVYAKQNVPSSRVLHCAHILSKWIDNDENGEVDNVFVHQELFDRHASMVMWWNEDQVDYDDLGIKLGMEVITVSSIRLRPGNIIPLHRDMFYQIKKRFPNDTRPRVRANINLEEWKNGE